MTHTNISHELCLPPVVPPRDEQEIVAKVRPGHGSDAQPSNWSSLWCRNTFAAEHGTNFTRLSMQREGVGGASQRILMERTSLSSTSVVFRFGRRSKPMVPFWGRCTVNSPPILAYFSGWIEMFAGGTIWVLTHNQLVLLPRENLSEP